MTRLLWLFATLFPFFAYAAEPLPAESTLWDAPNLLLTPHAAGGRVVGAVERILANAAAVEATPSDEPLTGLEAQVTRASH